MVVATWCHFVSGKWESKTFTGNLSHFQEDAGCLCTLLSDLSPYQNFVTKLFFFPLIIEKENKLK